MRAPRAPTTSVTRFTVRHQRRLVVRSGVLPNGSFDRSYPGMRVSAATGVVMLAIASGACAALSGLSEYRECSDDCSDGDTNPRDGAQGAPAEASTSYGEAGGGQPVDVGDVAAFPPDSASEDEEPADAWTTNEGMDAAADAGADEATDAAIGVGTDAATDAGAATGPPP